MLADGRQLDAVLQEPAPPPPPPGAHRSYGAAAYAGGGSAGSIAMPTREAFLGRTSGTDWVSIARWFTVAYGVLSVVLLVAIGLLVRHLTVPVTNPASGVTTIQTYDIGPAFAVAAVVAGLVIALAVWLTQFTVARVIFLLIDALATIAAVAQLAKLTVAGGVGVASLFSVAIDAAYAWVIVMSLLPGSRPAR